jgi:superfamily II DNA or RNA helicase
MAASAYTLADLQKHFSSSAIARGKEYAQKGMVYKLNIDPTGKISASVRGRQGGPYRVKINPVSSAKISGTCSCYIGFMCKHMVATLMAAMNGHEANSNAVPVPVAPPTAVPKLPAPLAKWLEEIEPEDTKTISKKIAVYRLLPPPSGAALMILPQTTTLLKNGSLSTAVRNLNPSGYYGSSPHITPLDSTLLSLIANSKNQRIVNEEREAYTVPPGPTAKVILDMLLESRRCYGEFETVPGHYLRPGPSRPLQLTWEADERGAQSPHFTIDGLPHATLLPLDPPRYVSFDTRDVGLAEPKFASRLVPLLARAPALAFDQVEAVRKHLAPVLSKNALPAVLQVKPVKAVKPVPQLTLTVVKLLPLGMGRYNAYYTTMYPLAAGKVDFDYHGALVNRQDTKTEINRFDKGKVLLMARDKPGEEKRLEQLQQAGLVLDLDDMKDYYDLNAVPPGCFTLGKAQKNLPNSKHQNPQEWEKFVLEGVPKLKKQGWRVVMDDLFPYNMVVPEEDWYTEVHEGSGIDWFSFELGVSVDGERINLLPVLVKMLRDDELMSALRDEKPDKKLLVPMSDGRRLALPAERVVLLLQTLEQLFGASVALDEDGLARLMRQEAALLAEMEAAAEQLGLRWFGGEKIRQLGQRLREFKAILPVAPPQDFKATLRTYQQDGLNWLQFLRDHALAGILADDMGLGKTVQMLAHICTEKAAGRLTKPFLVIAPTSLMVNWGSEAKRFAPHLNVLTLHGPERKELFDRIPEHDLVLTTYPLLPRDKDDVLPHEFHSVVLDEAQTIKNARAKLTQIACQLKADHRLCMTGTPLENNLGEVWSLFNFLMPGYLGNIKTFNATFRNPIEKQGDAGQSKVLARRVKPFILRRTKSEVASELPPKTEIIRTVELDGPQRDLYETIRMSMHEKVRQEIAARGLAKSHIIVLDALLKLRQVCCDPSLLALESAKKVKHSAKRSELQTMLEEMVKEGRRILLFSQFTSMLALIEQDLQAAHIDYVRLTGSTRDRATPVLRFQNGEVPVFLISLKAGGTGLNLTAADTVIHYDPWWNPAAENQATDRAYRIGQDKPVFVYKLITEGTVEEKILEMQDKKRQLMDGLFDAEGKANKALTPEDISVLFEPL